MEDFLKIGEQLTAAQLDGWLIYDFRGSNPILARILGLKPWTTRRLYFLLRPHKGPLCIAHRIDATMLPPLDADLHIYGDRQELSRLLDKCLESVKRLAMEYVPDGALPAVAYVDAGTIENIRSRDIEVVSSGNLIQAVTAVWSPEAQARHLEVSRQVAAIKDNAFAMIREALIADRTINEFDVQRFILTEFDRLGLETEEMPVVSTNERSGDPHYYPTESRHHTIQRGDWVLIDLWARAPGSQHIFSDITWVGKWGEPSAEQQRVFDVVRSARDAVVMRVEEAALKGEGLQGRDLDNVARGVIDAAGYGAAFFHRTGHSLSPGDHVHGLGVNLDNFETDDRRNLIPGIGFTVEPGIYLSGFGVRLEINIYMKADGPLVTSPVQDRIIRLDLSQ